MPDNRSWSAAADPANPRVNGSAGLALLLFAAVLGCAFWAGAVFAAQPWLH